MKLLPIHAIILSASTIGSLMLASCGSKTDYDAQGTFEATEVTVSAEGTGKILSLNIEQGDSVTANRPVGLIDTLQLSLQLKELASQREALLKSRPDLSAQKASLLQEIAGTTTDRDRIQRLLQQGAATQQQLDNLNTKLSSLQGQLQALVSTMNNNTANLNEQANALEVRQDAIADQIEKCIISSPISGTVLAKIAEAGEVASFGKPLFKVADMDHMYLRAYFTSHQLSSLRLGQKVKVMADYGGGNEKEYPGTITFIATQSEFTPKTIQTKDSRANLVYAVKISVPNDGLLKIGLTGNVYVGSDND